MTINAVKVSDNSDKMSSNRFVPFLLLVDKASVGLRAALETSDLWRDLEKLQKDAEGSSALCFIHFNHRQPIPIKSETTRLAKPGASSSSDPASRLGVQGRKVLQYSGICETVFPAVLQQY